MKKRLTHFWNLILLAFMVNGMAAAAFAVDVCAGVSARETYVGLPVTLQIQVSNAETIDPPALPNIDGLQVKSMGTPARSTQITTINGRTMSRSSQTYAYQVTPLRSGEFRIPPITIHADGADHETQSIDFVASKSDTGDLMFVEIAGKEKQIYVGQALDVTLKIWLKPFRDREHQITLSEADMWKMVSDRSNWGMFADRMQQLADRDQRPAGKEVLRKGRDGVEHGYYLYEQDATIYPKRPGKIDASAVKIVVDYPTAIGKARDPLADMFDDMPIPGGRSGLFGDDSLFSPFASRLAVQSVRPIVAATSAEEINVLPIPSAGRPANYRGAVGTYHIATVANPTNVKAGDPIELSIGISGTGPMELVEAPPLAELPDLTHDFKVPNEPLAGFVKDDGKLFSVPIRPRRAGVTQIPAIPFSYFDPASAKFVTVNSDPISLHVEPADTLALDAIVAREKHALSSDTTSNALDNAEVPSFAAFTGDDVLAVESPHTLSSWLLIVLLAMPPVLVLAIAIVGSHRYLARFLGGFKSGARRFQDQITTAQQPAEVATALQSYLVGQLRPRIGHPNVAALLGALRSSGHRQSAIRCERVFDACARELGFVPGLRTLDELKQDARQVVADFQTESQRRRAKPKSANHERVRLGAKSSGLQAKTQSIIAALMVTLALSVLSRSATAAGFDSRTLALTHEQQKMLLNEATECVRQARRAATKDSADAKQSFAKAADKYQLLVESGVDNSKLYVNLANAYFQSGQSGKAIANYLRALKLDATNPDARANLAFVEHALNSSAPHPMRRPGAEFICRTGQI